MAASLVTFRSVAVWFSPRAPPAARKTEATYAIRRKADSFIVCLHARGGLWLETAPRAPVGAHCLGHGDLFSSNGRRPLNVRGTKNTRIVQPAGDEPREPLAFAFAFARHCRSRYRPNGRGEQPR